MSLLEHEFYCYEGLFIRLSPTLFCEPLEGKNYAPFYFYIQKSWHSVQYMVENLVLINLYVWVTITTMNVQITFIVLESPATLSRQAPPPWP